LPEQARGGLAHGGKHGHQNQNTYFYLRHPISKPPTHPSTHPPARPPTTQEITSLLNTSNTLPKTTATISHTGYQKEKTKQEEAKAERWTKDQTKRGQNHQTGITRNDQKTKKKKE
jgi:hypothetical protein